MLARQNAGSPIGWHEMVVGLRHRVNRRSPSVALLFQRAGLVCAFGDVAHSVSCLVFPNMWINRAGLSHHTVRGYMNMKPERESNPHLPATMRGRYHGRTFISCASCAPSRLRHPDYRALTGSQSVGAEKDHPQAQCVATRALTRPHALAVTKGISSALCKAMAWEGWPIQPYSQITRMAVSISKRTISTPQHRQFHALMQSCAPSRLRHPAVCVKERWGRCNIRQ
jgi:hypothetical protein